MVRVAHVEVAKSNWDAEVTVRLDEVAIVAKIPGGVAALAD